MYPCLGFCKWGSPISAFTPTKISVLDFNQKHKHVNEIKCDVGMNSVTKNFHYTFPHIKSKLVLSIIPNEVLQIHSCLTRSQFLPQNVCNPDKIAHHFENLVQLHWQQNFVQTMKAWHPPSWNVGTIWHENSWTEQTAEPWHWRLRWIKCCCV